MSDKITVNNCLLTISKLSELQKLTLETIKASDGGIDLSLLAQAVSKKYLHSNRVQRLEERDHERAKAIEGYDAERRKVDPEYDKICSELAVIERQCAAFSPKKVNRFNTGGSLNGIFRAAFSRSMRRLRARGLVTVTRYRYKDEDIGGYYLLRLVRFAGGAAP